MSIKLSDHIQNPKDAISDEEWFDLYKRSYIESNDEEMSEALMVVSAEADKLILNDK